MGYQRRVHGDSQKMLGAAGRAATGLVKQASKAGNVASVLPAASVFQRRDFSVSSPAASASPRDRLSPLLVPLLTFSLEMDFLRSSTPSLLKTGSPSLSWRSPSTWERTPSGPLPWTVPKVLSAVILSMTLVTPS